MVRYFPVGKSDFEHSMGLSALKDESWIEIDGKHHQETALKKDLLTHRRDQVLAGLPSSEAAQLDILDLVQRQLAMHHPDHEQTPLYPDTAPLAQAASLIQEDLVLMQQADGVFKLTAACVCFPSGWNLTEKVGLSVSDIHVPVPGLNQKIGPSIDQFFERLNPRKKVPRFNWGVFEDDALFQPEWLRRESPENKTITSENIGEELFFRVERQTLQRLPQDLDTLFSVRIFNNTLSEVTEKPEQAADLLHSLKTMPGPIRRYKAVARHETLLLQYLEMRARSGSAAEN